MLSDQVFILDNLTSYKAALILGQISRCKNQQKSNQVFGEMFYEYFPFPSSHPQCIEDYDDDRNDFQRYDIPDVPKKTQFK